MAALALGLSFVPPGDQVPPAARLARQMNMDTSGLESEFDAVSYGIFIPIFSSPRE